MEFFAVIAGIAIFFFVLTTVWNSLSGMLQRITIMEYENGLWYHSGTFMKILPTGPHWVFTPFNEIKKIDARPRTISISGQEVLSTDGITIKIALGAKFEVQDPVAATHKIDNYETAFYLTLQMVLREIIGSAKIEEVLEKRNEIGSKLLERAISRVAEFGIKLHSVDIKDIMFPGDLKKIFAQVVKAQKEGQAILEKARGETAALRNLANAAKLVQDNPALMQLRMLQHLGESSGNTLVYGVPPGVVPVHSRNKTRKAPSQASSPGNQKPEE